MFFFLVFTGVENLFRIYCFIMIIAVNGLFMVIVCELLYTLAIAGAHSPCFFPFCCIVYYWVDSWCYIIWLMKGRPTVKPLRYRTVGILGTCQLGVIKGLPTSWSKDRPRKRTVFAPWGPRGSWNSLRFMELGSDYHVHNIPPRIPALIKLTQPPHSFIY